MFILLDFLRVNGKSLCGLWASQGDPLHENMVYYAIHGFYAEQLKSDSRLWSR